MKRGTIKRLGAVSVAAAVGVTSFVGYGRFTKETQAADTKTVVFAEGKGTGKDFQASSWTFNGQAKSNTDGTIYSLKDTNTEYLAKILANPHSTSTVGEPVIRLIDGVVPEGTDGLEDASSFVDYRSGEAFLNEGIKLDKDSNFSMKFTFSMPDACVNTTQTGGKEYAREVGGDGIAFVMTTESSHDTKAGSGIGYEGLDNSMAIELDSFFNGAYCYMAKSGNSNDYPNWGFDNQLYFHQNWDYNGSPDYDNPDDPYEGGDNKYVQYRNYKFSERFDHIGITLDGKVTKHEAISYINGIDPTELQELTDTTDGHKYYKFKNLAYFDACAGGNLTNDTELEKAYQNTKIATNKESDSSTCDTRFADKNVNDRLFTVWVDYDGTNIYVRYANGDFASAVRPDKAQITQAINLSDKFGDQTVYMGFTSAVGSSKANHTIHSFEFTNEYAPITGNASYKVEYYLQDKNDPTNYILQTADTITKDAAPETVVTINDNGYKKEYPGYEFTTIAGSSISEITVLADGTAVLKLYYNYNPVKAKYKTEYWLEQPDGSFLLDDTVLSDEVVAGTEVKAADRNYTGYEHVTISESNEKDTVEADGSTVLKVYYKIKSSNDNTTPTTPSDGDNTTPTTPANGDNATPTTPANGDNTTPTTPANGDNTTPSNPSDGDNSNSDVVAGDRHGALWIVIPVVAIGAAGICIFGKRKVRI